MFTLHPQLEVDTLLVGDLPICRVLLSGQFSQYPWLILVPRRTGCRDLTDLPEQDYLPVMEEVRYVHDKLREVTKADKMNIAALGNAVPQLHIHIIARFQGDEAWPGPVWGKGEVTPYPDKGLKMLKKLREVLDLQAYDA
ncbi:MAG: HIT domain-containing protein [Proteobacteria bacterium]|nr:HIT domain-containing protein [Pseudomonadota bacterium]